LSFFLCEAPTYLLASSVRHFVFEFLVASPAVASFVVAVGAKHCARFGLVFHESLDVAIKAASIASGVLYPLLETTPTAIPLPSYAPR
jgi:hypothetical protein